MALQKARGASRSAHDGAAPWPSIPTTAPDQFPSFGGALPPRCGIGLKPEHFQDILSTRPDVGFFEIHAENYFVAGGPFHHYLSQIRLLYPLSIHGVGLSIGAAGDMNIEHLRALRALLERYQPQSFSEHLAWSTHQEVYLNDLLPVPYNQATLQRVCDHIDQVQSYLQRKMLLENPSTYVEFSTSTMTEIEFICEVLRRTGCGLLLDVNNVYVSCTNHHRDPRDYLRAMPLDQVGEIHLAGFAQEKAGADEILIDSHGAPVDRAVWALYGETIARMGPMATLLERDNDVPDFAVLRDEALYAETYFNIEKQVAA